MEALRSKPIIQVFDPTKELRLTTDAIEHTMATVLQQDDHPVVYLSVNLTVVEPNYSNMDKALAMVWSNEIARNFLLVKEVGSQSLTNSFLSEERVA